MTLLRLIQRASILAGMTFASLSIHSNSAHADDSQFCAVTNNGQTACGKLKTIERLCVTTDGTNSICGKFKSFKPAGQEQEQGQEARTPTPISGYRKEVDNFVYTLEGCQRVGTSVRCQVRMVNKGKERGVALFASKCALVDSNGKSYPGSKVDLGGGLDTSTNATMPSGMDVSIAVTFENISGQLVKAQVLNVGFSYIKPVQFRNFPISN